MRRLLHMQAVSYQAGLPSFYSARPDPGSNKTRTMYNQALLSLRQDAFITSGRHWRSTSLSHLPAVACADMCCRKARLETSLSHIEPAAMQAPA